MKKSRVLFVGGNVERLASVKIRCANIAERLGCDIHYRAFRAEQVPEGYDAYVCVKPDMREPEVQRLAERALVVWDILDHHPPVGKMRYIASSQTAADTFPHLPSVTIIPHHHCNFEGTFNAGPASRPIWVGNKQWYPELNGVEHDACFVDGMTRPQVAEQYRRGTIALNFRAHSQQSDLHVKLNSGIKLINCMGFGIPSVSADEPAYREYGADCTLFAPVGDCGAIIETLRTDTGLFEDMRRRCREHASEFSLDAVVERYRQFIESL